MRLWSSGFELNSTTAGVEWTTASGTLSIQTTVVRSGTYAAEINVSNEVSGYVYQFSSANSNGPYFFRFYLRVATAPSANATIMDGVTTGSATRVRIRLNTDRTLQLSDEDGDIGSASDALSLDTWYRIEVEFDVSGAAGSHVVRAKLDGTEFAGSSTRSSSGIASLRVGAIGLTTGHWYLDDIAINDSTGSFQNSYPGEGSIIHLRPNAAGDNAGWVDGTGSTFAEVDEVTPDDITTFISTDADNTTISDFNIDATPAAIESDATINLVHVGARFNMDSADAAARFVLGVKATSGGTVEESAGIAPTGTTWVTNAPAAPRNYPLTLYDLPGASTTPWTKADLDTAQIRVRISVDPGVEDTQISTMWLLVDYTPAEAPPSTVVQDVIGLGIIPFAR